MWLDNDVRGHGEAVKRIRHPVIGRIAFEYSAFAIDGRPDLSMIVYNPATPADAENIRSLIESTRAPDKGAKPVRSVRKRARRRSFDPPVPRSPRSYNMLR